VFFFGDIAGGEFCQHVHHQFLVGHIVTKVFLLKAFETLVFSCGK
jgi:hypothetical protein